MLGGLTLPWVRISELHRIEIHLLGWAYFLPNSGPWNLRLWMISQSDYFDPLIPGRPLVFGIVTMVVFAGPFHFHFAQSESESDQWWNTSSVCRKRVALLRARALPNAMLYRRVGFCNSYLHHDRASSIWMIPLRRSCKAKCKAVSLPCVFAFLSIPRSSNILTVSELWARTARCRRVYPPPALSPVSAPRSRGYFRYLIMTTLYR